MKSLEQVETGDYDEFNDELVNRLQLQLQQRLGNNKQ